LLVEGGSFGLVSARGQVAYERGVVAQSVAASVERSGGFIEARDFATAIVRARTAIGQRSSVAIAFLRKEFGARNFYGAAATGDAMSREWTNQTLICGEHAFAAAAGWDLSVNGSYRTHGDRFLFNQSTPAAANVHRTHEMLGELVASRAAGAARLTIGAEGGGNWIRSTNLGNHSLNRISGFAEWRQPFARRVELEASLRGERYSEFGTSWSPSAGLGYWPSPSVRVRSSVTRAFRVPTFTERFYSDRNHIARNEVTAEYAWSGDAGVDVFLPRGWLAQATLFGRAETDVIDWLCANNTCGTVGATERWRTYNIRDVDTRGLELAVQKTLASGAFVHVSYTGLTVDAAAIGQLSKYVLDYAPRSLAIGASIAMPGQLSVAPRLEYRRRARPSGRSEYALVDVRISRRVGGHVDLFVDGTNLFDVEYQEIPGVRMPGAAMSVGLRFRGD
jgi:iron complex outermembrane receptor protein